MCFESCLSLMFAPVSGEIGRLFFWRYTRRCSGLLCVHLAVALRMLTAPQVRSGRKFVVFCTLIQYKKTAWWSRPDRCTESSVQGSKRKSSRALPRRKSFSLQCSLCFYYNHCLGSLLITRPPPFFVCLLPTILSALGGSKMTLHREQPPPANHVEPIYP